MGTGVPGDARLAAETTAPDEDAQAATHDWRDDELGEADDGALARASAGDDPDARDDRVPDDDAADAGDDATGRDDGRDGKRAGRKKNGKRRKRAEAEADGARRGDDADDSAGGGTPHSGDGAPEPPEPPRRPRDVEATLALTGLVWQRAADALLVRSRPQFDELVLDVGTGAASAAAAALVGPGGRVDAVLRDASLALLAREASGEPLRQLVLHRQGLDAWSFGDYDVVQLALALDVVGAAELERTARELVSRVRPGGRFGVVVWTTRAFGELVPALVAAAAPYDAQLAAADPAALGPSVRHDGPAGSFAQRLTDYGLVDVRADELPRRVPLDGVLAWQLVIGTELVHLLDGVDGEALPAVRDAFLATVERDGIVEVDLSMLAATGVRPED